MSILPGTLHYAILHPADASGVRLAPLYDLNSVLPYRRSAAPVSMSMRIGGVTADADSVDRFTWDSCARDLRLPIDLVRARVDHLLDVVPVTMATAAIDPAVTALGSPLPARLVDAVTDRVRDLRRAL